MLLRLVIICILLFLCSVNAQSPPYCCDQTIEKEFRCDSDESDSFLCMGDVREISEDVLEYTIKMRPGYEMPTIKYLKF